MELIAQPSMTDKEGEAADLPYPEPLEQCYTMRGSVSTDDGKDSASTSVIMDPDYVVLDHNTNTILQPSERNDEPPPARATGATGIRRIASGTNHSPIMERMDIDLAICKPIY